MMLVAGFSGIGKTAVVNEVHKPIVRQRGYFIKGKFDQFNRNIPFSAFVQAFRDLMGQLLGESDAQLAIWKTAIGQSTFPATKADRRATQERNFLSIRVNTSNEQSRTGDRNPWAQVPSMLNEKLPPQDAAIEQGC